MKRVIKRAVDACCVPVIFVVVIWVIRIVESLISANWAHGGILPRHTDGLMGILTSPLLHGGFGHLISNTIPLLVLGWRLFFFYKRVSRVVFPLLWLLSGFLTWCIGREAWHIGASGIIYALASYLFFSGFFSRYIPLIIISILIAFLYGGLVWGLLPLFPYVSWEGHLSGAIAGCLVAYLFRKEHVQRA
ncbi:MAG: rhomboid family intramembrane serine protease [Tannerellaceae bacterium]|nr:rhomboid family intramembrane serine protease [Tannerellaceae bacterium]